MPFKNFSIWRGRLPHWRADDVTYYVEFRHRRPLSTDECVVVLKSLLKSEGRRWEIAIACSLPEKTELLFTVGQDPSGVPYELSDLVEKAKTRAGKLIVKQTGERFPPFYNESYDRIVRDEAELEERWNQILSSPVDAELAEDPEEYEGLWVRDAPR